MNGFSTSRMVVPSGVARAGAVFHDDCLSCLLGDLLRENPRDHIARAACSIGNNDPDGLAGKALRTGWLGHSCDENCENTDAEKFAEHFTPRFCFYID